MNILEQIYFNQRKLRHIIYNILFRKRIINNYLKNNKNPRLHLACGERIIKGWLNADLYHGDIYLNLTKKIPLKNNLFELIYSHHFIEHITTKQLIKHFKEAYRILKNKGKIRIVTPDLEKLFLEYKKNNKELITHYCKDSIIHPTNFFNIEMRQYGEHVFIYDFDLLKQLLKQIGFKNIKKYDYGDSDDFNFKNIDFHGYKHIDKISLCVEAEK